jgi:hypothetical protein
MSAPTADLNAPNSPAKADGGSVTRFVRHFLRVGRRGMAGVNRASLMGAGVSMPSALSPQ